MDTEQLVQLSWKRHGSGIISFVHNPKNGIEDAMGEDFSRVRLEGYAFHVPFQIKTSNNGKTIGLVLPFREQKKERLLTLEMKNMLKAHQEKHSHVRCLLFVAKPCKMIPEDAILRRVWIETIRIFQELEHQRHRKHGKIRPLVFLQPACYNACG